MAAFLLCGEKRGVSADGNKYLPPGAGQGSSFSGAIYDSGITLRICQQSTGTGEERPEGAI